MKLFKFSIVFLLLALGASVIGTSGCKPAHDHSESAQEKQLYTCGMHPQIIQDHPGNCPICGMKLTPVRKQAGGKPSTSGSERKVKFYKSTMNPGEVSQSPGKDSMGMEMVPVYEDAAASSSEISIDPVTMQNMGIRTGVVTRGPLRRVIRTVSSIGFNETAQADVTTKFKGWVEKLHVDATGQQVHKGDPLFDIYSPDLWSAQTEYLLALKEPGLRNSALTKLQYFDISEDQIAEIAKSGKPKKTLTVNAPIDGFVIDKMVVEGQMVDAGMKIYRLADLAVVWVQSQVYEQDLGFLKLGQEAMVSLSYLPDAKFRGRVTYIYPTVDEKTRTAQVRMEFHNPGYLLKPGMFATVEIAAEVSPSVLLVPESAVLRSGEKNTVFVALDGGKFDPREVKLGLRSEGNAYQVLSGLKEGERVVTSGQFMLDSESQLREAIAKMQEPQPTADGKWHRLPADAAANPSGRASMETAHEEHDAAQHPAEKLFYVCPMPEHVSILHDAPGKCPICGMELVPVGEQALAKLIPEGKVEYYTCPMPEHSSVHQAKPGKCPICGMTLIPVMEMPKADSASAPQVDPAPASVPKLYTCPMASHADVVSDKPGDCPKCGMKLVETTKVKHGAEAEKHWKGALHEH